ARAAGGGCAPAPRAQGATGALRVAAVDETSRPAAGISLALDGPGGARAATTDERGQATLVHLWPGRHHLRASAADGRAAEASVGVAIGGTPRRTLRLPPPGAAGGGGWARRR